MENEGETTNFKKGGKFRFQFMVEEVVRQFNRRLTPRETKDLRVPGKM